MQLYSRNALRIAPRPTSSALNASAAIISGQLSVDGQEQAIRLQVQTTMPPEVCRDVESTAHRTAAERTGFAENEQRLRIPISPFTAGGIEEQYRLVHTAHLRDIAGLKSSHSALLAKVSILEDNLRTNDGRIAAQTRRAGDSARIRRTLQFARHRAVSTLQSVSNELNRRPLTLSESNSVIQVILKSSPTHCTMQEFQDLVSLIRCRASIRCNVIPSDYAVHFPSIAETCGFEIQFETYKDICDVLELDIREREIGVYREKGNIARNVRVIQVSGVDMRTGLDRKILLGRSFPSRVPADLVPYLHQERPAWREGSWEQGFSFKLDRISSAANQRSPTQRRIMERARKRTSDLNQMPLEKCKFAISWEGIQGVCTHGNDADAVPGYLRSFFPAVVLVVPQLE